MIVPKQLTGNCSMRCLQSPAVSALSTTSAICRQVYDKKSHGHIWPDARVRGPRAFTPSALHTASSVTQGPLFLLGMHQHRHALVSRRPPSYGCLKLSLPRGHASCQRDAGSSQRNGGRGAHCTRDGSRGVRYLGNGTCESASNVCSYM